MSCSSTISTRVDFVTNHIETLVLKSQILVGQGLFSWYFSWDYFFWWIYKLLYSQWMVSECFSMKWRYIDIEPLLNFIPIKVERVFLSYKLLSVSSHYPIFYQHIYARQLSNRSIFHAGRYLDDKEICYLRTVIVTANVYHSRNELIDTGHISQLIYRHL